MKRGFCTYFDSNYLTRGIVMLDSLLRHHPMAAVYVLCLDEKTRDVLGVRFGPRVMCLSLSRLWEFEPRLPGLRGQRSTWAFYATHKPVFLRYVMEQFGPHDWLTFVDADVAFYGNLSPVFAELGYASIGLSPHRFPSPDDERRKYGEYNAGFICLSDDAIARQCLDDWRNECIAWCHEQPQPDGRFMNQGYLNRWPERYANVAIVGHPGANLAPWNLAGHQVQFLENRITVDGKPLIFFHFSGVLLDAENRWYVKGELSVPLEVREKLYVRHVQNLARVHHRLLAVHGISGSGSVRR